METSNSRTQVTRRPKWAKRLKASEWLNLQEGPARRNPTLRNLTRDAETCRECKYILGVVQYKAQEVSK